MSLPSMFHFILFNCFLLLSCFIFESTGTFVKGNFNNILRASQSNTLKKMLVLREERQTAEEYLDNMRRHGMQNSRDDHGIPTLCSAIDKFRSPYLVEELLKDGAEVNSFSCLRRQTSNEKARRWYKRWGNFSAIHLAVSIGHYEVVKVLWDNGADLNSKTTGGIEPIDFLLNDRCFRCLDKDVRVSESDDFRMLKLFYIAGVDLSTSGGRFPQSTLLRRAAMHHNQEMVRYLISVGCDVNCIDSNGKTPLYYRDVDNVDCAKILLENGANPNSQDNCGNTIYHHVVEWYRCSEKSNSPPDFLRLLHEFHVNPNICNNVGKTAMHLCFEKMKPGVDIEHVVDKMLEYGADPNVKDELDRTPTYYLIKYSRTSTWDAWQSVWSLLIKVLSYGAILKEVDIIGIPLLHALVESCLFSMEYFDLKSFTEVLHPKYKVEVNCRDVYNRTVLHLVSAKGNWRMAEILLNHGANTEIVDRDSNTPLHVAILCKQWTFARKLLLWPLRYACSVNYTTCDEHTSLHTNSRKRNPNVLSKIEHNPRNNSVPALNYRNDHINYILAKKDCRSLHGSTEEFCPVRNERSNKTLDSTMPFPNNIELHQACVKWTTVKLDTIAKYVERDKLIFLDKVEPEIAFCNYAKLWPTPTIDKDFLDKINKSSLFKLFEENSLNEFHLNEECEEEHCLIAKQVFELMTDLVTKCSEIDPRLKSNLVWTGSSADGTKMWLPDEFDFLMELVQLRGNCEYDNTLDTLSQLFLKREECQEMWSNLCLYKGSINLSLPKVKKYIAALLWKAAFLLDRKKYKNIRFRLCKYGNDRHTFIKITKVGVNIKVCWYGEKYKKLIISIDLTPAMPVSLTEEHFSSFRGHSVRKLINNYIHVIPYVKYGVREIWRPSFSLSEVHIMKSLSRKQIALYKGLKFFRDIHKSVSADIPSYYLKTFLFNFFFLDNVGHHTYFIENGDFHSGFCHILHHLNLVACSPVSHQNIQHFFLKNSFDLADYDMRWVGSTLSFLENC